MTKITLDDLEFKEEHYWIDGCPYNKKSAELLLVICNYTGKLTAAITVYTMAKVIKDIQKIKDKLNLN